MNRRGLVAHYKYHGSVDATGVWNDLSGNDNHGTLGSNAFVDNQGVNLDGMSDYVNCGNGVSLQLTQNITLASWIKCTTQENRGIITKYTYPSPGAYSLQTANLTSGVRFVIYEGSEQTAFDSIGGVQDNAWHHVVATYDKSYMRIYIDGDLDSSKAATHDINNSSDNLNIGARTDGSSDFFAGIIDDIRVYNRRLSAEEILQIYHETKGKH